MTGQEGDRAFDLSKATINGALGNNEDVFVKYTDRDGILIASSIDVVGPIAVIVAANEYPIHGIYSGQIRCLTRPRMRSS